MSVHLSVRVCLSGCVRVCVSGCVSVGGWCVCICLQLSIRLSGCMSVCEWVCVCVCVEEQMVAYIAYNCFFFVRLDRTISWTDQSYCMRYAMVRSTSDHKYISTNKPVNLNIATILSVCQSVCVSVCLSVCISDYISVIGLSV